MTRLWPGLRGAAKVVQPETILRWHRSRFKAFWRWKSGKRAGRPKIGLCGRASMAKLTLGFRKVQGLLALWSPGLSKLLDQPSLNDPEENRARLRLFYLTGRHVFFC
jgi:hypothetical protein